MEYCPHCMKTTEGSHCQHCGGEVAWTAPTGQLAVGTQLRGSSGAVYMLGAAKGQGGFGITYAAMNLMNGRRVAIKEYFPTRCATRSGQTTVRPQTNMDPIFQGGKKSFLEEAMMLSAVCALKSVVSVQDYFEANGTAYIVMEYVDGIPLHEVVRRSGVMKPEDLLPKLPRLLGDLHIMHTVKVIHRDISPDNLILTPDGSLKLLDFGSARSIQDGKSMTVMLKAGFSPVEQYQSKGQGPYTDVYALAATIYYCLTGVIPPSATERLMQKEDSLVRPNQNGATLTPQQENALMAGMALQPTKRPQTMEAFSRALFPHANLPRQNIQPPPGPMVPAQPVQPPVPQIPSQLTQFLADMFPGVPPKTVLLAGGVIAGGLLMMILFAAMLAAVL